jgi:hypothetical protein
VAVGEIADTPVKHQFVLGHPDFIWVIRDGLPPLTPNHYNKNLPPFVRESETEKPRAAYLA